MKSGLEITQGFENGTIRKLGYGFLFVFLSNVLSCIISEIKQDIGQNRDFSYTYIQRRCR